MKLENSIRDNKAVQNLRFNTETKLVRGGPRLDPHPAPVAPRGSQALRVAAFLWWSLTPTSPCPSQPGPLLAVCLSAFLAQAAFLGR